MQNRPERVVGTQATPAIRFQEFPSVRLHHSILPYKCPCHLSCVCCFHYIPYSMLLDLGKKMFS